MPPAYLCYKHKINVTLHVRCSLNVCDVYKAMHLFSASEKADFFYANCKLDFTWDGNKQTSLKTMMVSRENTALIFKLHICTIQFCYTRAGRLIIYCSLHSKLIRYIQRWRGWRGNRLTVMLLLCICPNGANGSLRAEAKQPSMTDHNNHLFFYWNDICGPRNAGWASHNKKMLHR